MSLKSLASSIAILTSVMPINSVNANPSSCKVSAITVSEREAVEILQNMYGLQSQMDAIDKNLDELNRQRTAGYNPHDVNSVERYNKLANKYNSIIEEENGLSNKYNLLKNSFNAMLFKISPSTNTIFINCLNIAVLDLNVGTSSLNINSTSQSIDSMNIETENMRRSLENLGY